MVQNVHVQLRSFVKYCSRNTDSLFMVLCYFTVSIALRCCSQIGQMNTRAFTGYCTPPTAEDLVPSSRYEKCVRA
uniref:Uncharacterized protein n=1 Tax=Arundo donax TaxID=35708 RepID=A0A0A9GHH6_ARUDO